jgi:hypothetical protein
MAANNTTSISAHKKCGMANPARETVCKKVSIRRLTAATTPVKIPSNEAIINDAKTSSKVAGSLSRIRVATSAPYLNDFPRFRVNKSANQ